MVVLRTTDAPRTPAPVRRLIDISRRLRPRDYTVASLLDEHTTLTTDQLTSILFTSATTCRHRLQALRMIGFVDRFLRNRPGAPNPVCWLPGPLSARYTALARGEVPPTARVLRERQDRIYASPKLDHLLASDQFFVTLLAHARHHPGTGLLRWWSERATAAAWGQRIHPDGHGVWSDGEHAVGFHLEMDRGTEFSGGHCPCWSPDLRVCAAQRLMVERYLSQQVWCKDDSGVSPVRVAGRLQTVVYEGRRRCSSGKWDGSSWATGWESLFGRSFLSPCIGCVATRSVLYRAWYPCRGAAWGRCGSPPRDGHRNRPMGFKERAACSCCGPLSLLSRKTLWGLSRGGKDV